MAETYRPHTFVHKYPDRLDDSLIERGLSWRTTIGEISHGHGGPDAIDLDSIAAKMWDKMYIQAQKVIGTCQYCHAANAISNPTCVKCGAPMGESK